MHEFCTNVSVGKKKRGRENASSQYALEEKKKLEGHCVPLTNNPLINQNKSYTSSLSIDRYYKNKKSGDNEKNGRGINSLSSACSF